MKKLMILTLATGLLACASYAQKTAAQWAGENAAAIKAAADPSALADLVKQGPPAFDALFAQVKTAGETDPLASVKIAALSQFVMTKDAPKSARKAYADALLAAAQKAKEPDVACVFLDQLRWCGMPEQAKAVTAFTQSADPSVAELAKITLYAVTDDRAAKLKPSDPTACRRFNEEMAKLAPAARSKRLMEAFDGPDNGVAGAALVWMNAKDNAEKTSVWIEKLHLMTAPDPTRRIMLIDALAVRGDKSAATAIAACLNDPDASIIKAAQAALLQLDAKLFTACLTDALKTLAADKAGLWRDAARQMPSGLLIKPLLDGYNGFNAEGKKLALDLFRERRVAGAAPLALAATASDDENTAIAGYRALRDAGAAAQAEAVLERLPKTAGRVAPEAQSAYAAIAKRDASGATTERLRKAMQENAALYDTAARIGGPQLLSDVEKAATSGDDPQASAAIRALAAWTDTAAVPTLMRLALTATAPRNQALALNGVKQKLGNKPADKAALHEQWKKIRDGQPDSENKNAIDELFK